MTAVASGLEGRFLTSRPPRQPEAGLAASPVARDESLGERSPSAHPRMEKREPNSSIRVAVRIRPLPAGESGIIDVLNGNVVAVRKAAATGGNEALSSQQGRTEERSFDRVFGPDASQAEVYAWSCEPLLVSSLAQGCNATVFVYGATGAGKTHTMFGEKAEEEQGLIVRAVRDVFRLTGEASVKVSFLELYNERVYDLLQEGGSNLCSLLEDERKGLVKISNLTEVPVSSAAQALQALQRGLQLRKVESTAANQRSSRSHAVFSIQVDGERSSRICLIDLAGSERASHTQNVGGALRDGAKINQSLLALANCINALGTRLRDKQKPPYRDSKLTLLLKSSLIGDGLVSMIANVHPGKDHFEDASNTLEYAKRASIVKAPVLIRRDCRRETSSVPARPRARGVSPPASPDLPQGLTRVDSRPRSVGLGVDRLDTPTRERSQRSAPSTRRGSSVPSARVGIQRRPSSSALDSERSERPDRPERKLGTSFSQAAAEVVTPQLGLLTPQRSRSSHREGASPCEVSATDIGSLLWGSRSGSFTGPEARKRQDSPAGTTAAAGTTSSSFLVDSPSPMTISRPKEDLQYRDPEVLLRIVESLQAEKAALDSQLRAVTSDRDRLRSANLEKDRQLALLLAAPPIAVCPQCGSRRQTEGPHDSSALFA